MTEVVYFVQADRGIKIGATSQFIHRMDTLKKQHEGFKFLGLISGYYKEEARIQSMFWSYRIRGDWFRTNEQLLRWIEIHTVKKYEDLPHRIELPPKITPPKPKSFTVLLPERIRKAVQMHAIDEDVSMSHIVQEALIQYFDKIGKPIDFSVSEGAWGGSRKESDE